MILIFDFDGTLTPYPVPQYELLKQFGITDEMALQNVSIYSKRLNCSIQVAYYTWIEDVLKEHNYPMTMETVCQGADKIQFNPGVIDFLKESKDKNYIITSGFQDFVEHTKIASYIDKIYGITYIKENEKFIKIDKIVTNEKKADIIKQICIDTNTFENIVYLGDGLTDMNAFAYVKSIHGTSIFVGNSEHAYKNYLTLKEKGFVDAYFTCDYRKGSDLYTYLQNLRKQSI
ncbi:MAG: haloacid dehalogenase-like hydrolase [Holdemanella sp.]|nr:haloacid dehalogenase-like hydrolase [Holdemanella sp.]